MKCSLIFLTVFAVHTTFAVPVDQFANEYAYSRFVEYTDADGKLQEIDLEETPDQELLNDVARNPANNQYILYTRRNPTLGQTLINNNDNSVRASNFNPRLHTVVVAHGWISNQESDMNPLIRDAYLQKYDVNVIIVDWRRLAYSNYVTAARGVPAVGRGLGQFLAFLHQTTGAAYENMHLVGFSLGAHLVGNAGRYLGGRIARITGLDPAGPLWTLNSDKLNINDARYTEVIHTDGGLLPSLGTGTPLGNTDFFPNGGNTQPGCLTSICHHNRAWRLFAASVTHDHMVGTWCSGMTQVTLNTCRGGHLKMGNADLNKNGSGIYRVKTARSYPF